MNIRNIAMAMLCLTFLFTACKKDKEVTPEEKGSFNVEFENQVDGEALVLDTKTYTNANGDQYNINTFKYYVSNVTLTKADGGTYVVPESYYLVDASKASSSLVTVSDVPAGDYTKISFLIGVDKERNTSGAQTGALDPALGMFWTWNSGYIFLKLEGTSPQSTAANNKLTFHIGGFTEPNNTIRTFTANINTANPLRIREDKRPQLHFKVNVASLFKGKQNISFANLNTTMGGANSVIVADNYENGLFSLDHIHN